MAVIEQGHAVVMFPSAKLTGLVVAVVVIDRALSARVIPGDRSLGMRWRGHGASPDRHSKCR
jgi:hypothetical protein